MPDFLPNIDAQNWHLWAIYAAGIVGAIVTFFIGLRLIQIPGLPPPPKDLLYEDEREEHNRDRRKGVRRRGKLVAITVADGTSNRDLCHGWVVDRSSGGMRILVPIELVPGRKLRVRPHRTENVVLTIEARHTERRNRKEWLVGCNFVQEYPLAALLTFG